MGLLTWLVVAPVTLAVLAGVATKDPWTAAPVPDKMWAVVTTKKGEIELQRVDLPKPAFGEVLVKMSYAPINPSDVYMALGDYSIPGQSGSSFPHKNGLEGSGVAVGSGGGVLAHAYSAAGLRLAVPATPAGGQTWAEYALANPLQAVPLPGTVSDLQGSAALVNPLTVVGFLELAGRDSALVHTAASSALGLQLLRAAPSFNITVICVVRGEKNAKMLVDDLKVPRHLVLRQDVDGFDAALKKVVSETGADLAFDAVGGSFTERIFNAMPAKSRTFQYGALSGEPDNSALWEKTKGAPKTCSFFHVKRWLDEGGPVRLVKAIWSLMTMLPNELSTEFVKVIPLNDPAAIEYIRSYAKHQKGGKVALKLDLSS